MSEPTRDETDAVWEQGAVLAQRADWEREQVDYARRWDLDALAQPCRDCEVGEPHMCPRMGSRPAQPTAAPDPGTPA